MEKADKKTGRIYFEHCPYCEFQDLQYYLTRADKTPLKKCRNCGLIFVEYYDSKIGESLYRSEDYFKKSGSRLAGYGYQDYFQAAPETFYWQKLLVLLLCDSRRKRLLDVGCASGNLLYLLRGLKEGVGIDISEKAVEIARSRGLNAYACNVFEIDKYIGQGSKFDVITAFDFIEHVPEPKKLLSKIKTLLSDDGIFLFSTPDCSSSAEKAEKENCAVYRESLEHLLFLTADFVRFACKDVFNAEPSLFTKRYGGYFTLICFFSPDNIHNQYISELSPNFS